MDSASFNGVNWLTSPAHYAVHETITRLETDGVTEQEAYHPADGDAWHTTSSVNDQFTLTDPYGDVSSYDYDQPTEDWTTTAMSGNRIATSLVRSPPVITQAGFSTVGASIDLPVGQDARGTVMQPVDLSRFTLLSHVDVTVTYDERQQYTDQTNVSASGTAPGDVAYVGQAAVWSDERDPGHTLLVAALPGSPLAGLLSLDVTTATGLARAQQVVGDALGDLTRVAGSVSALQTQVSTMQTFDSALSDALTSGIGSLVDADMNVASMRLQALQTQQQLGVQALSMANQNSQLILKLFQAA